MSNLLQDKPVGLKIKKIKKMYQKYKYKKNGRITSMHIASLPAGHHIL